MDRRQFLKISAAATASAALASCTSRGTNGGSYQEAPEGKVRQNYEGVGLLGYGCMRWPMVKDDNGVSSIDQHTVNVLVDKALEHGVNYFDSAPVYLQGKSEEATAKALLRHPRESYLIATKCSNFQGGKDSFEADKAMYQRSLALFQTDYIDYYLLHSIKSYAAFKSRFLDNGLLDYLVKEREEGHIRNLGFSFHGTDKAFKYLLQMTHDTYKWDFVQIQMNYRDWKHATRGGNAEDLYAELVRRDIPVVIMEPLLGGGLSVIPAPLADRLKEREPEKSVASWAFRFCGSFPKVLTVLSGMDCQEHLDDNLRTYCNFKPLSEEEFAMLEEIAVEIGRFPLIRCTACQYCMPCPYGINIPAIFAFYNRAINEDSYVKSKEQKDYARKRRRFLATYDKAIESVRQADHCLGCGKCAKACPQRIKIPNELSRIDKYVEALRRGEFPEI